MQSVFRTFKIEFTEKMRKWRKWRKAEIEKVRQRGVK